MDTDSSAPDGAEKQFKDISQGAEVAASSNAAAETNQPVPAQVEEIRQDAESVTPTVAAAEAKKPIPAQVEDFPDPDEDDLDDLDDMLDDFSAAKLGPKLPSEPLAPTPGPSSSTAKSAPPVSAKADEQKEVGDMTQEEVAQQLELGMAGMLRELEKSPGLQNQFEEMLKGWIDLEQSGNGEEITKQLASAGKANKEAAANGTASKINPPDATADAPFVDTIRRTMDRMNASAEQATAAAASGGSEDIMSELLKQMSSGDFGGEGGSEEDFSKMLMSMMEQLTNKEILYEPMKELHDKYPEWMEKNKATTPADELKRFEEQKHLVAEIVGKFEESTYSDDKASDREYIVERMHKMQAAGSPPTDLVGDLASAQEAFAMTDDQCNPQ